MLLLLLLLLLLSLLLMSARATREWPLSCVGRLLCAKLVSAK